MAKNPNKIKNGSMVATVIIYIILALLALICIYPVWYVIIISFSRPIAARTLDVFLIPKGFSLVSYQQLFKDTQMWTTYGNTVLYASVCVVGMLITSAMAAYPLTSPYLFAKKVWVFFILIPMYFSGGLIPQFIIMTKLGMYNTRWAILVPGVVSMWYIILVRTYFATIPEDLRESARIDGANNYGRYRHLHSGCPVELLVCRFHLPDGSEPAAPAVVSETKTGIGRKAGNRKPARRYCRWPAAAGASASVC